MAELERCPICGKAATLIHMVDSYDGADYGWDAGCASASESADSARQIVGSARPVEFV